MNVFHQRDKNSSTQTKERELTTKILLGLMGAQMLMRPLSTTAFAESAIVKADSNNDATITKANGVYSVFADRMNGDVAFNHFSKFSLDESNIANLHFAVKDVPLDASQLFNFVDGHIDINGTVNAIRNGGVGGQLFFLSDDGISVGAGGVINAGSINLLTPTSKAYDKLLDQTDLTRLSKNVKGNAYAINPEGTITIAGQLNAVDGIKLRTAKIKIEDGAILRTGTATTDADGNVVAISDAINFDNLVNTKNADGTALSAGINGGTLHASQDANGDIVLSAIAASTATGPSENGAGEQVVTNFTPMTRTATITAADGSQMLSRGSANIYATATNADEGWSDLEEGGYHVELANPLGQVVFTKADIQLSSDITAKNNIDVEALSSNEYKSDNDTTSIEMWEHATGAAWTNRWTNQWNLIKLLHDKINLLPIYSYMESEANVTVSKTAKLTALNESGKGIGGAENGVLLSASSTAINKVYASSTSKEAELTGGTKAAASGTDKGADETAKEAHPTQTTASGAKRTHLAGAAVSYDGAYSTANVTVEGDVTAKKDVAIEATSKTDVKAKASENGAPASSTSTSSKMNAAVAVLTGGNHSNVTIGKDATVESTEGSIEASAHTENKFETIASVTSNTESVGATAVGVNVFDGDATVEVDGTLESAKDTTLSAFTDTPVNGVTVSNNTLPSPAQKKAQEENVRLTPEQAMNTLADVNHLSKFLTTDNLAYIYQLCAKTVAEGGKAPSANISEKLGKYADLLTVGASIGVGVGDMDADVKMGKTAKITAGGAIDVKANALLEDIYMSSMSSMTNTDPEGSKLMAGAAVMVSDFKNNAHVTVKDGTQDAHAVLHSNDQMTITADSTQTYDRIGGILYDLHMLYSGLEALTKSSEYQTLDASDKQAYQGTLEKVGKIIQDLNTSKSVTGVDLTKYTTNLSTFPTSVVGAAAQIGALIGGFQNFYASVKNPNGVFKAEVDALTRSLQNQFLVWTLPESYFNYSVDSSISNVADAAGANNLAVAGSANVNLLDSAANVKIGKSAELESDAGAVDIDAASKQNTAVLNGKPNVGVNPDTIPDTIDIVLYGDGDMDKKLDAIAKKWGDWIEISPNTAAPNAVGGVVGVAEHATEATVTIGDGAKLTGHDATVDVLDDAGKVTGTKDVSGIAIAAEGENNTVDISFGAGKAGKIGFEGLFSWLGGTSNNKITIDGASLTSFGKGTSETYGNVDILSHTNNILTNVVGAIAWGSGGASMGASVGVLDAKNVNDIALMNTTVDAASIGANALTDGVMNNVTIAGSLTTEKAQQGTTTKPADQMKEQDEDTSKKINQGVENADDVIHDVEEEEAQEAAAAQGKAKPPKTGDQPATAPTKEDDNVIYDVIDDENGKPVIVGDETEKTASKATKSEPKFQLAAAGSASVNVVSSETKATVDGGAIRIHDGDDGHVNVKAEDGSYIGAYSGAAAVNWQQGKIAPVTKTAKETVLDKKSGGTGEQTKVTTPDAPTTQKTVVKNADGSETTYDGGHATAAISGAVALNISDQTVTSKLSNVTVENAKTVQNIAQKDGALVAAGLGLTATKKNSNEGQSAFDATGSVSFNEATNHIDAMIAGSTITASDLANIAYDSDTQVAGGANLAFVKAGKTSVGIGASAAVNDVHNDIDATLTGSKVTADGTVQNHAAENLTQIGAAVGVAATTGGNTGIAIDATLASNNAKNDLGATISNSTLTAGRVENAAYDADDIAKPFDQAIENSGVNATGSTYLENATNNAATNGRNAAKTGDMTDRDYDIDLASHGSTKQITAALSVSASTQSGGVAGAGAAAIGTLRNTMDAVINTSTIDAASVASQAASDAVIVDVAAGVSLTGGSLSGAGSVGVQYTTDKTRAYLSNSTVTADDVAITADSGNVDVTVAGQAGYGQNGVGLAVAVNHLGNTTGAYLLGSDVTAKTEDGVALTVAGKNHDTVVSVGAGVTGGQTAAMNGSLAINQGNDDAEAIVDATTDSKTKKARRTNLEKARKLLVKADDSSTKVAVAGAINGAGTAAVGGALAYNEIGTWEQSSDNTYQNDREQQTRARVRQTNIATLRPSGKETGIAITASDTATIGTAATSMGGAGTAAVDGAIATSVIAREAYAGMDDVNVEVAKFKTMSDGLPIDITSKSEGSIYNAGVVAAGAGTAAVGAGIAVNYDNTDNTAIVKNSLLESLQDFGLHAETKDKILNVGLGGAGSTNASVTGSLGVNILGGKTQAVIKDDGGHHEIASQGNAIIEAQRSGSIDNLVGVAAGSGIGASVGASIGVNVIANDVIADVGGETTRLYARGKGEAETVSDQIADDAFLDGYPADKAGALTPATYMKRKDSTYKGIAVSASSTNEIHDWALNITGGGIGASVGGNVTVNTISGKTKASISGKNIKGNRYADDPHYYGAGDIHVTAHDYANTTAYTGALAGNGIGAGVGIGSSTLTISRETSAEMKGKTGSSAIADNIGIDADAQFAAANLTLTGAGAIAGVANVDNIMLLSGKTTASLTGYNTELKNGNLDVSAKHGTNLHTIGIVAGAGAAGVGLGIDVVQDSSKTTAELADGSVKTEENGKGAVTVEAVSTTHDNYKMITETAGGVGLSTNVSVGNFNAQTTAHVKDMTIGSSSKRTGAADIHAKNETQVTADTWQGSAAGTGLGTGIQIATIGSDTDACVENSNITATSIDITADDEKNANFRLGNTFAGGIAGGLNVGVLTVGHKVENTYSIEGNDSGANLADIFLTDGKVNTALSGSRLTTDATMGTGIEGPSVQTNNGTEEDGGKADAATTTAAVTGGTLDATGDVTVKSNAAVNAKTENIYAGASLASFSGQVGVLDDAKQTEALVKGANISGKNIAIGTGLSGTSALDMYQGAAAGLAASGAFAFSRSADSQGIDLAKSTIEAQDRVTVKTADDSTKKIHAYAVQPTLLGSASFQLAEADVIGKTGIALESGNTLKANTIDIKAQTAPTIETDVKAANTSLSLSGGVSISTIETGDNDKAYQTTLDVADGNKFLAENVDLAAISSPSETSTLQALSAAGGSLIVNYATNRAYNDVAVNVGNVQYGAEGKAAAVTIEARNELQQKAHTASTDASLSAGVANNTSNIVNTANTSVTARGADGSHLKSVTMKAAQNMDTAADASSYGGSIVANVAAAEAELSHTGKTTATIRGTWDVSGNFTTSAENSETLRLNTDTGSAAIVNGSGSGISTDVNQTANVLLNGATIQTTGNQDIRALNDRNDIYGMQSSGFGFAGGDATRLDAEQTYHAGVSVKDAKLTADGGNLALASATTGTYQTENSTFAVVGLAGESVANTKNRLTYENKVDAANAVLQATTDANKKNGVIRLASYDAGSTNDHVTADSKGLVSAESYATLDTDLTRTNDIHLQNGTRLESGADMRLTASRDTDGKSYASAVSETSETHNHTLLPFHSTPDITYQLHQKNTVTVDEGAAVASAGNIAITADQGGYTQKLETIRGTFFGDAGTSDKVEVTEVGQKVSGADSSNAATINGTVTAGAHHTAKATITGKVKQGSDGTSADFSDIRVTVDEGSDQLSPSDFKLVVDTDEDAVTNPYYDSYMTLVRAQAQQPDGTQARTDIDRQIEALCKTMEAAGFADIKDGKYIVYKTIDMAAVDLPDITVSGANIDISADTLAVGDKGSVKAHKAADIEIENSSNLSVIVHNLTIPESGGNVYFNGAKLSSKTTDVPGVTGAARITAAEDTAAPAILIRNTGSSERASLGHTPDIDVRGNVVNEGGSITLENQNGNIRIGQDANVSGLTVTIKADNGNVVQYNPNGTSNLGGDPIAEVLGDRENRDKIQLIYDWCLRTGSSDTIFRKYVSFDDLWNDPSIGLLALCKAYNADPKNPKKLSLVVPQNHENSSAKNGIVAGGLVSISAHEVNLNGLIQSGYADYSSIPDVDYCANASKVDVAARMKAIEDASHPADLTDDDVRGLDRYCILQGGAYYDNAENKQCYAYQIPLYYNPVTKHIVVSDVTAGGGSVYIKGEIASTSDARILVASGPASITIGSRETENAFSIGTITNHDREGTIDILDTLENTQFHYRVKKDGAEAYYQPYDGMNGAAKSTTKPDALLRYVWTGGVSTYRNTHYTKKTNKWLFGSIDDEKAKQELVKGAEATVKEGTDEPAPMTNFVQKLSTAEHGEILSGMRPFTPYAPAYFSVAATQTEKTSYDSEVTTHEDKKGLFGWVKTEYTYDWDTYETSGSSMVYSLDASDKVKLQAIEPVSSGISIKTVGDILIDHPLNTTDSALKNTVDLQSSAGSIHGSGLITTNQLKANARTGINLLQAACTPQSSTRIDLATMSGDVALTSKWGDVNLVSAWTGGGPAATIQAAGNIWNGRTDQNIAVQAPNVYIFAENGAIGTKDHPLTVYGGTLRADESNAASVGITASAYGDIHLASDGDMPIDFIESQAGDVSLTSKKGSILNAAGDVLMGSSGVNLRAAEAANIIGKNVTLSAPNGSIGKNGVKKFIPIADLYANKSFFSSLYPGMAEWTYDASGNLTGLTIDTGHPLYVHTTGDLTSATYVSDGAVALRSILGRNLSLIDGNPHSLTHLLDFDRTGDRMRYADDSWRLTGDLFSSLTSYRFRHEGSYEAPIDFFHLEETMTFPQNATEEEITVASDNEL